MAKRSPILGYNHNVRYRGLIFHVQTEDSGLLSPHLFTHLFYGGVILSTRKLVYDAGSAEDAIKGLMQAQHKVVLKELKAGKFDDKIDEYLAGTEGLLPRSAPAPAPAPTLPAEAASTSPAESNVPADSTETAAMAAIDALAPLDGPPVPVVEHDELSEPEISIVRPETEQDLSAHVTIPVAVPLVDATPPAVSRAATPPLGSSPRTRTAERKSAPTQVRTTLPPASLPLELAPTLADATAAVAAAVAAANATVKTEIVDEDSTPEIQILAGDDHGESDRPRARTRSAHDTEVQAPLSDGVPGPLGPTTSGRLPHESVPPIPVVPERRTGDRGSALGAAALPPARPISRPPSRQIPTVMSRPLTQDDARGRDSDTVEVYAPAPPTADPPPPASERPGQYAQHKRVPPRASTDVIRTERERPGSGAPPLAGGVRSVRSSQPPGAAPQRTARESLTAPVASGRARRPTPPRVSASNPAPSRPASSGGVVMTRPAVIVGAPSRPSQPRVRKAREEEARGFGQGLISEKSLDEVILAYLSEDGDDK